MRSRNETAGLPRHIFAFEDEEWKVDFQSPDKKLDFEAARAARDARMSDAERTELEFEWMCEDEFPPELWKPPSS